MGWCSSGTHRGGVDRKCEDLAPVQMTLKSRGGPGREEGSHEEARKWLGLSLEDRQQVQAGEEEGPSQNTGEEALRRPENHEHCILNAKGRERLEEEEE